MPHFRIYSSSNGTFIPRGLDHDFATMAFFLRERLLTSKAGDLNSVMDGA